MWYFQRSEHPTAIAPALEELLLALPLPVADVIERMVGRLKDFRRIATRYDKLAANFAPAVALATVAAFWC